MQESEWKIFRQLRVTALERFCEGVLAEIAQLGADSGKSAHEKYLAVFKRIMQRDKELAYAFNDPRRSTALQQLAAIHSLGLLTEDEFARFSPDTRDVVKIWES
jgi:hypothetical protein